MTDAQIGRLGERGVRLDESRSGSGLGISIAREIVALNGGTLEFTRSAMGGLAVTVSLPASLARA
jgi:signal transduction histidine kinase